VQSDYKEEFNSAAESKELSFETPACQNIGLGAEEMN
jgi:hypothetical protein